jgi:CRP-like cAMP-binding protein
MPRLDELIATSAVFAGLEPRLLATVAGCGALQDAAAGAELFREGRPADRLYLIRDGAVAIEVSAPGRGAVVIGTLHAGEVAGWSWLFPPFRWHFDGRVVEPTRLVAFDAACLRAKCDADHELGHELMRRFAATAIDRLQATRLQLLDVYANPGLR